MTATRLPENVRARIEAVLDAVDAELRAHYPGSGDRAQPVHTVYVPADRVSAATPREWGAEAVTLLDNHRDVLAELGDDALPAVRERLTSAPIQDLRIDFEDGYGFRPDAEEDAAATAAGTILAEWANAADGPAGFGVRIKGLGGPERRRAIRTLELVLDALDGVPDGFVFTVPKIRAVRQVSALAALCEGLERGSGLPAGSLRFELQIESPQAVIAADGTVPVAAMISAAGTRCHGLHFGTYDYTAACGVAAPDQALDHPAADFAKAVMQVAAAQTGVWVCDGSTQIVPDSDPEAALRNHHRLVERALRRGYYQGWDMHPGHLVTRWLATYQFFRAAIDVATPRLRAYVARNQDPAGVLDEPATAEALAATVLRGLRCGARTEAELATAAPELTTEVLRALVARKPVGRT
ncbi:aldolase [Nocardia puris]|uniref:HpcH/HpaI aldolase/citrate lyase family protein n=1 Tax=Nocardia puris TaxID=208602 RepID=A0A366DKQ0_9NOCA|nr:aldolase/citrate lyase family protein [Nocardia puris]MBF6211299.1 aldolase [Nocardia puris]RBO90652.1 HpcH/HpaI aldolase/citrate lyase family protein [Nocardia puris]